MAKSLNGLQRQKERLTRSLESENKELNKQLFIASIMNDMGGGQYQDRVDELKSRQKEIQSRLDNVKETYDRYESNLQKKTKVGDAMRDS